MRRIDARAFYAFTRHEMQRMFRVSGRVSSIASFIDRIAELTPQFVTFNGNTFDLPVLRYRGMIHAVAAPGLTARPYFNRYTEDALDLCDVLSKRRK